MFVSRGCPNKGPPRNVFSHSPGGQKSEVRVSVVGGGVRALSEGSRKDLGVPAVLLRGGLRLPARVTGLARGDRQWLGLLAWSGRIVRTSWGELLRSQR